MLILHRCVCGPGPWGSRGASPCSSSGPGDFTRSAASRRSRPPARCCSSCCCRTCCCWAPGRSWTLSDGWCCSSGLRPRTCRPRTCRPRT
uniref:Uncharacterized protein n=1 Tax=Cyclopterus lumpus TaxID=8103 RepID=A0A8C3AJ47_CYCLU